MGKISTNLGVFVTSLFVTASAVYLFSPVLGSHADTSKQTDINLSVNSTIALRTNMDTLNLSANVGSFVHSPLSIDVATNSQYGYTLTLEDKDDNTNMVATNASVADAIESNFSGAKTSAEMADNTWGFSLDEASYYQIPVNGSPVALKRTNSSMNGEYETTTVDFGAKVGMLLTAGTYEDVVVFTAYVNGQDGNPADGTTPGNPGETSSTNGGDDDDGYEPEPYDEGTGSKENKLVLLTSMQDKNVERYCDDTPTPSNSTYDLTADHFFNGDKVPTAIVKDKRNGKKFGIAKLADGRCWMTDNLMLNDVTLTSKDSNLPEGETWTLTGAANSDMFGEMEQNLAYDYVGFKTTYYNWYTATAGEGTTEKLNSGTDTSQSVCAKRWHLPSADEYRTLISSYSTYNYLLNAFNNGLVGSYGGGGPGGVSMTGSDLFFTSTPEGAYNGDYRGYFAYMTRRSANVTTASVNPGAPVRCVSTVR